MYIAVDTNQSGQFDFFSSSISVGKYIIPKKLLAKSVHASLQSKSGVFILKNENYVVTSEQINHCLSKHHVKNENFIYIARSFKNKVLEQSVLLNFPSWNYQWLKFSWLIFSSENRQNNPKKSAKQS